MYLQDDTLPTCLPSRETSPYCTHQYLFTFQRHIASEPELKRNQVTALRIHVNKPHPEVFSTTLLNQENPKITHAGTWNMLYERK